MLDFGWIKRDSLLLERGLSSSANNRMPKKEGDQPERNYQMEDNYEPKRKNIAKEQHV